jgi:hypothetical protein
MHFLGCFQKFIDDDMWQLFADQTNIYAIQFLAATHNLKPSPELEVEWIQTRPK